MFYFGGLKKKDVFPYKIWVNWHVTTYYDLRLEEIIFFPSQFLFLLGSDPSEHVLLHLQNRICSLGHRCKKKKKDISTIRLELDLQP